MAGPLVSVIFCAYNQREFVVDAIESVLAQTYAPVELVAIDNGSTDDTAAVLRRYADRPNVLLLLHQENAAPTKRLNDAIARSHGEFISILYGDDYYLPQKLERQVACFAGLPAGFGVVYGPNIRENVLTGERWVESDLGLSGDIFRGLLTSERTFISPISPLVRRKCFERYPFQEDLFAEGEGIYLRFALRYRFQYLAEPLTVMREHAGNIGKVIPKNTAMWLRQLEKLEAEPDFPGACRPALRAVRVRAMENLGWWAIRIGGDRPLARRSMLTALRWNAARPRLRSVVGLVLAALPSPLTTTANRLADQLRHRRVVAGTRRGYE